MNNRLFQWDQGQNLAIVGGEAKYIDFSAPEEPSGIIRTEGNNGIFAIPDSWLQTSGNKTIWVCLADDTQVAVTLRVQGRPKPPTYVETPAHKITIDLLLERANQAVEETESSQRAAAEAAEAAAGSASAAQRAATDAGDSKTSAAEAASSAKQSAETAASAGSAAASAAEAARESATFAGQSKTAAGQYKTAAEEAAEAARQHKISAGDSATEAKNSASAAELAAQRAEANLEEKGWVVPELRQDGHLYLITENMDSLNLKLQKGRLIAVYE